MSLSAYCLQALVLPVIVAYIEPSEDGWRNMLISLAIVILIWGMLKIKIVRQLLLEKLRIVPKIGIIISNCETHTNEDESMSEVEECWYHTGVDRLCSCMFVPM